MFRYKQIWVDPLTAETDPVTATMKLRRGVITRWWVGFPDGCADLVHAAVYHYEHRILPRNEQESLFWNNYVFEIPESYILDEEPYEIEIRVWSDDDSNRQYVVVGVAVEPIEEVTLKDVMRQFLERLVGPT